ncbi:M48 family metalloprotease [Massilia sp. CF038]|uniref:M48 family metalloprotease n=1 Tax=Massilia sp. CF038 TaxID=1881045 RepID=UPI000933F90F|nr:M48 family metalloprotease [Massilia sp. CF038]
MSRHRIALLIAACLMLASRSACALSQDEVVAGAEKLYRTRVSELAQARMLDQDRHFLARVQAIVQTLARQAQRDDPGAQAIAWEVHISSDTDENASCMAGGKMLLGQPYSERLGLNDAELAMILSHEMQHAILLHNLAEYQEAIRLAPAWRERPFSALEDAVDNDTRLMTQLASINLEQEVQADQAGLLMAWRAGWRASHLAGYYRKLEQASPMSRTGSPTHPAPLQRWRAARQLAARLDAAHDGAQASGGLREARRD